MDRYRVIGVIGGVPKGVVKLMDGKSVNVQKWLKLKLIELVEEPKQEVKKFKRKRSNG